MFIDEFCELPRTHIESLRQPLEEKILSVSRIKDRRVFPCNFILIAGTNPCPCGYLGNKHQKCICSAYEILRYKRKLSGPIVDRIDLITEVASSFNNCPDPKSETSHEVRNKVINARTIQKLRYQKLNKNLLDKGESLIFSNAQVSFKYISSLFDFEQEASALLQKSFDSLKFSLRTYSRISRVARTIADLEGARKVEANSVAEALQFRLRS